MLVQAEEDLPSACLFSALSKSSKRWTDSIYIALSRHEATQSILQILLHIHSCNRRVGVRETARSGLRDTLTRSQGLNQQPFSCQTTRSTCWASHQPIVPLLLADILASIGKAGSFKSRDRVRKRLVQYATHTLNVERWGNEQRLNGSHRTPPDIQCLVNYQKVFVCANIIFERKHHYCLFSKKEKEKTLTTWHSRIFPMVVQKYKVMCKTRCDTCDL